MVGSASGGRTRVHPSGGLGRALRPRRQLPHYWQRSGDRPPDPSLRWHLHRTPWAAGTAAHHLGHPPVLFKLGRVALPVLPCRLHHLQVVAAAQGERMVAGGCCTGHRRVAGECCNPGGRKEVAGWVGGGAQVSSQASSSSADVSAGLLARALPPPPRIHHPPTPLALA